MEKQELIPHLFRTEYRKIVSVLCKRFGFEQIEIAEDIASDTFMTAAQTWGINGMPQNPTAWLYNVAKNKAKNYWQRESTFKAKVVPAIQNKTEHYIDVDLSPQNINDSQLQMMFAICHPSIPSEAQIGLSLRILCGFGIEEIADAFLTNKEVINKRLFRAKEKLRKEGIKIELPGSYTIAEKLPTVLTTIYLMFSEGYYSVCNNQTIRKDLCLEAMRLCKMLVDNETTNLPEVNALLSLMCFQASRFEARINKIGEYILYDDQDTSIWNLDLINEGIYHLHCASVGDEISKYHLEAAIAYWSTQKSDSIDKWENVLQLYNHLLQLEYSPIAALNRTFAFSKIYGKQKAILEAEKLYLINNHFYYTLLGELYTGLNNSKAKQFFLSALSLARTRNDIQIIEKKIEKLKK